MTEDMVFPEDVNAMTSVTENGWQTMETFEKRIERLEQELKDNGVQFPVILELDGHATRYSLKLFRFCLEKGM